jgi:3-deoxy-D-manno-octulosonate 8-phosphate phosphatase (KDO 8-P phosphatase)
MSPGDIQAAFEARGGQCWVKWAVLQEKLARIRAYVFDWDGVFNDGTKAGEGGSPFSEPDAMGTNMLRFSHWLDQGETLPLCGIITGASNPASLQFARREHLDFVYRRCKDKREVLLHLEQEFGVKPAEVAFVFDDILDLGMAERCGLRLLVRRPASPLMTAYVQEKGLADYLTGQTGGQHALREVCELLIGLRGNFSQTLDLRIAFGDRYRRYLHVRNLGQPRAFVSEEAGIIEEQDFT